MILPYTVMKKFSSRIDGNGISGYTVTNENRKLG